MIVVGDFRDGPTVEHFIHNQKPHAVTQVKEFRRGRIVRSANRVDTKLSKQFKATSPHTYRHRRAKGAAVMMHGYALELEISAVEPEARSGIEVVLAYAEGSRLVVKGDLACSDS